MTSFEVSYPIVGTTRFVEEGLESSELLVADTYLNPLHDALFATTRSQGRNPSDLPQLMKWWSALAGPFSTQGGRWSFPSDDGLLELLRAVYLEGMLRDYDLSKVKMADGSSAKPMHEFLARLISFLELANEHARDVEVEELP